MERLITALLVVLLPHTLFAQDDVPHVDFSLADSIAQVEIEVESVEELAEHLAAPLTTEVEKARAFFMWIAHNVRYDCRKYHNPERPYFQGRTQEEVEQKKVAWRTEQIQKTLERKRGVCEDYSQLFKALCDAAGLEATVISGDARDFYKPYRSPRDNPHAWNAVRIDGDWHLLDATWGAGHTDPEVKRFTRNVKPGYFMTPPDWLIQSHFPDDPEWQLLRTKMDRSRFSDQPMVNFGQTAHPLLDFATEVRDGPGGTSSVWFKFDKAPKYFMIATKSGKPVKFEQREQNGRVVLNFKPPRGRGIYVYMRDSTRAR
ncbi:MAG: transglutaminase domain-containing protein, partial [Saprospiraceae bacterium]|nr:transglutaminase domain-containing protein [Saprospiraceae bacterium]